MVKRTLYFGNPAYLRLSNAQLIVEFPDKTQEAKSVPVEDVGMVVIEHPQVTISHQLMTALIENNAAMLTCDGKRMPCGLFLPMAANHLFTKKLTAQLTSSEPLRKRLWQQTISAKIRNQAALLKKVRKVSVDNMLLWADRVRSGDPDNLEGRASAWYWQHLFEDYADFTRGRYGEPPNNMLNYGYAVLRSIVARSLVGSGMLPAVGIHHHNQYNAFCLADDIMEPYRPIVDQLVVNLTIEFDETEELTKELKARLLTMPVLDVCIEGKDSPLMVGTQRTAAGLMRCFEGEARKIPYPEL